MKTKFFVHIFFLLLSYPSFSQSTPIRAVWDDGLKFRSDDGLYKFSVGGRVHYDLVNFNHSASLDSAFGESTSKTEVRRARISFEGRLNNAIAYEFEFTFNERIEFADMYVAFLRVPGIERLTVGHFREPFGLEESTSSNAIVLMERSLTSSFGPSRNLGLMLQKDFDDQRWRIYSGIFRITDDLGADLEGQAKHSFSSRLVFNPLYDTVTNKSLHIGAAFNRYTPTDNSYLLKVENETNIGPAFIKNEVEDVKNITQIGGELAYSKNRLTLQSEYIYSLVNKATVSHKNYGLYAMASYFLKGGRRSYNREGNKYSSISVQKKYNEESMSGAWEIGARLSHLNNPGSETSITRTTNATAGLNWYYNSNSRIMMNYIHSWFQEKRTASTLLLRIQVTF